MPRVNSIADFVSPEDLTKTENLELLAKNVIDGLLSGRHRSRLKGGSTEFAEHRAYCPGDEIRLLDWRVYGKSDRYCIKQFEEETSLQVVLTVDASGSMGFGRETISKYDYSRRAALCLARLILWQRDSVGLAVTGGGVRSYVPPRSAPRHLEVLLNTLAKAAPGGPTSLAADLAALGPRIKRRGMIILLSDCFEDVDQLAKSMRLLRARRHEVLLFHILAPEELSFSFRHWTRFESLEEQGQQLDLDPMEVRAEYLARLKTFLEKIRYTCAELGCDYVPAPTAQPIGDVLADYLRRRAAGAK
jgi:uncharacterized protein (DUF58 family)